MRVKLSEHDTTLTFELNDLKTSIWHDLPDPTSYILHEKDVKFALNHKNKYLLNRVGTEYHRFRSNKYTRALYDGLKNIINNNNLRIIGAVIVANELNNYFSKDILTDQYLSATQMILENYCHFLQRNNGVGYVVYESRKEQDINVRMRFNQIKVSGTMYVSPYAMQERLINIEFFDKSQNVTGLQIADFMPNCAIRKISENLYNKRQSKFTLYQSIRKNRYDGGVGKHDRFGIKILP